MSTLREHLEAIRDAHDGYSLHPSDPQLVMACRSCDHMTRWPCPTREHAVAALAILDKAERGSKTTIMRRFALVHDPEGS